MFGKLLIAFITIPMIEMFILIKMGQALGFLHTIILIVGTGFIGAALARREGFNVWMKIQGELNRGKMPTHEMIEGVLILIAGIVLLTPGLLTDIAGLFLLIPYSRQMIRKILVKKFASKINIQSPGFQSNEEIIEINPEE